MSEQLEPTSEVRLPEGTSASTFLQALLTGAAGAFPRVFSDWKRPRSGTDLKKRLPSSLLEFEQLRVASAEPSAIARHVVTAAHRGMALVGPEGRTPLTELQPRPGLAIEDSATPSGTPGWAPELRYEKDSYTGERLRELVNLIAARGHIGPGAATSLYRALGRIDRGAGRLDLSGERFAILGAGAEIAPTRPLLEAGATVLWCDIFPPPPALRETPGRLLHLQGRADLLTVPDQVAHAVSEFAAEEGPVHLGMFAYGPGKGREWRLGAAMNAVARAIPPARLLSAGCYISPTSPARVESADAEKLRARWDDRVAWQRGLTGVGALRRNRSRADLPCVADTVVPIQGVSYQAAQYVEKRLAMEALAADRPGLRMAAAVAPITKTRSIEHPVFAAAFRGCRMFGVEAFPSEVTRSLGALIYVDQVLGEPDDAPRNFHGGLYHLPFALEGAIRVAALKGSVTRN